MLAIRFVLAFFCPSPVLLLRPLALDSRRYRSTAIASLSGFPRLDFSHLRQFRRLERKLSLGGFPLLAHLAFLALIQTPAWTCTGRSGKVVAVGCGRGEKTRTSGRRRKLEIVKRDTT